MNNDIEDRFYSCSLDENLTTTEEYQASEDANKLLGQGTTHQPELYKIPPEILLVILSFLKTRDLNAIMLASRWLSNVASNPVLWKKVFKVNRLTLKQMGPEPLFEMDRLSKINTLDLSTWGLSKSDKLKAIISGRWTQTIPWKTRRNLGGRLRR